MTDEKKHTNYHVISTALRSIGIEVRSAEMQSKLTDDDQGRVLIWTIKGIEEYKPDEVPESTPRGAVDSQEQLPNEIEPEEPWEKA